MSQQDFVTSVRPFSQSCCFAQSKSCNLRSGQLKKSMSCLVPATRRPRASAEFLLLCRNENSPLAREDKETLLSHGDIGTQKMLQNFTGCPKKKGCNSALTLQTHWRRVSVGFLWHVTCFASRVFNCVSENNVRNCVQLADMTGNSERYL